MVARGFEEESLDIRTDSPTICKKNFCLVCNIGVSNGWTIHSLDVKAAFLQGSKIERAIHLLPPPEANTTKLWKLNTSVYGLCDAPRAWYQKLSDEFTKVGATKSSFDSSFGEKVANLKVSYAVMLTIVSLLAVIYFIKQ